MNNLRPNGNMEFIILRIYIRTLNPHPLAKSNLSQSVPENEPCSFIYILPLAAFPLAKQHWIVATDTALCTKSEMFSIKPFSTEIG